MDSQALAAIGAQYVFCIPDIQCLDNPEYTDHLGIYFHISHFTAISLP